MTMSGEEASSSVSFRVNQVVWALRKEVWCPAVVVDESFASEEEETKDELVDGSERLFWLGHSHTDVVKKEDIRDFCVGFKDCYRNAANDAKTVESVKVAVQLAAVRAQEVLEDPTKDWLNWALNNLSKFEELILSDTFYKSLGKKPKDSEEAADGKSAFPRVGQLVWVKEEGKNWPGICVRHIPKMDDKLEIVVVFGPSLRRKTVSRSAVSNFCTEFTDLCGDTASGSAETAEEERIASIKRVVAVVCNQSEAELTANWLDWSRSNLSRYADFCLSSDDVRDILANTSRTAGKAKAKSMPNGENKAKSGPASATASARPGAPLSEIVGLDGEGAPVEKKKRISFGHHRGTKGFTEEDKEMLSIPLKAGWERILARRREPTKKFGDIYYKPPGAKRLRSMKEVMEFVAANPTFAHLTPSHFSFNDKPTGLDNETVTEPPPPKFTP